MNITYRLISCGTCKTFDLVTQKEHESEVQEWASGQDYNVLDTEGVPRRLVGVAGLNAEFWEYMAIDLPLPVILAAIECEVTPANVEEAYSGEFDTWEDLAFELWDSCGYFNKIPEHLQWYIDWDAIAHDLKYDYCEHNGYFFRSM